MKAITILCAVAMCLGGLIMSYAGFMALDIAPGLPLGLGMIFTGIGITIFGPLIVVLELL